MMPFRHHYTELMVKIGRDIASLPACRRTRRKLALGWELHLGLRCVQASHGTDAMLALIALLRAPGFDGHQWWKRQRRFLKVARSHPFWHYVRISYGRDIPMPPCKPPKGGTGVNQ